MEGYKNKELSFQERAVDLVSRMSLEEKVSQVGNVAAAIPRLDVPAYNYWSEASHGLTGIFRTHKMDVTIFPVCLAMSNTWDKDRIEEVAETISDEIRAYHNMEGDELHFWCPTINLTRDPRWGRNDESFGEDPFLAGKLSAHYIHGIQGFRGIQGSQNSCDAVLKDGEGEQECYMAPNGEPYVKAVATPKHYALNNSECNRHTGSSDVDEATLREYYCKVFEYAVREGFAQSIMTSYNRVNGIPSSVNTQMLQTLLREEWGFDGFVVSDCGAVADVYANSNFNGGKAGHFYAKSMEEASAMTLTAGTDMSCGREHKMALLSAVEHGLITEDVIDRALVHIFTVRFRLGLLEGEGQEPYASLGAADTSENPKHQELAERLAEESIVLLKNDQGILPLSAEKTKRLLVVGPNAIYRQLGGYSAGESGMVDSTVNVLPLAGIQESAEKLGIQIEYAKGWNKSKKGNPFGQGSEEDEEGLQPLPGAETGAEDSEDGGLQPLPGAETGEIDLSAIPGMEEATMDISPFMKSAMAAKQFQKRFPVEDAEKGLSEEELWSRAKKLAAEVDTVVVIAGTDPSVASEESDRADMSLPYGQDEKIQELLAINPNTVVFCMTLGPVTGGFIEKTPALAAAYFGGQAQGRGIAHVLFGEYNPSGRLTETWYLSDEDLPPISQYGIRPKDTDTGKGRTYQYFTDPVQFPFGHGLSYTKFSYRNVTLDKAEYDANDTVCVRAEVTNEGSMSGGEVVQLYVRKQIPEKMADNKPARQLKGFAKLFLEPGETKTVTIEVPWKEITFWNNRLSHYTVEPGTYTFWLGRSAAEADVIASVTATVAGEWKAPLSTVTAEAERYVLEAGEQTRVLATATKEDAVHLCLCEHKPVFTSSNDAVATVEETGVVTAKSAGVAKVTVSVTVDGMTKSACVPIAVK